MDRTPDWIAVDWGTSNVRAWAMTAGGEALAEATSDKGMGKLSPPDYEPALLDLIGGWMDGPIRVVACGMVGARQGWVEAPYASVPGHPLPVGLTLAPTTTPGLSFGIIPGLAQSDPADVMRGEETKVAGFLARNPGWDGVLLLPGTHPKWISVSAGEVVAFRTSLTGEAFAALSGHTVLRHSVATDAWDDDAFLAGVAEGLARPEALMNRLFALRAESLLSGLTPAKARARLSGLLIGTDLAGARGWWLGARVALLGAGDLMTPWRAALTSQGVAPEEADATEATLAGLTEAWRRSQ
ncbi:2-dehydro-3-deoxygalactonokinase [Rubellimicrobium aerolatum]|uniref:2-dehydro-3-deoxygalactonokinase n=1 Tax=Rubellimicrobium aerolatum TaxID=490979 RepID=A0ABW0SD26_9RHOB|nr:2-dehydro-3-deoxygalactonokinase [Rubellimicrobium aerolatum]MBP1806536.1 2-dehydro-3-deoxygalactonokinase [Rubellimicrobium aerolatum]